MIPIEFIKLEKPEKARSCCFLAETYFNQGKKILIAVKDEEQGRALDRFMWTWRKTSFIPHALLLEKGKEADEPVLISDGKSQDFNADILIMAHPCPVEFIRLFMHAFDFAELHDQALHEEARKRFVLYREEGFEPRMR